ncbi:MAG: serine/threonine-protein kinase [Pirellulaceae bacterium]
MNGPPDSECPSEARILTLLSESGISTRPVDSSLIDHVDHCLVCRKTLERLTESGELESWRQTVQRSWTGAELLDPPLKPGDLGTAGEFAIEALIGSGGMGAVFRGRDDRLRRAVAVKVLSGALGDRAEARFLRESQAAARLEHDHLVPVHAVGRTARGIPFLVMPLIEGESLRERIAKAPVEIRQAAEWTRQVADGLVAIHSAGLVHRDIKPANILIDRRDQRARLTDFGLVRGATGQTLTQADVICGTPEYMSPERIDDSDSLDPRGDIYSLGITLYEFLTGVLPFRGRPLDVLELHRSVDPVAPTRLNRDVPRDLETVCLKAMAKNPDQRYASALELRNDLARHLQGRPVLARRVGPIARSVMWCGRNRGLATAIGLLFFVLVGGLIATSTLWLSSARNARSAMKLAGDLQSSRDRIRDSVQRFQRRVFSGESLHWQMSSKFRAEMFTDLIGFLDEFAQQESLVSASAIKQPAARQLGDDLTTSYLAIAETASEVGQWREAALAAERAFERNRRRIESDSASTAGVYAEQSRAARLLWTSLWKTGAVQPDPRLSQLSAASIADAARAVKLAPDNMQWWLEWMRARIAVIEAAMPAAGADDSKEERLREVFRELSERKLELAALEDFHPHGERARLAVRAGCMLLQFEEVARVPQLLAELDVRVEEYREDLRSQGLTLLVSDRLRGQLRLGEAEWCWRAGQSDKAFAALEQAVVSQQEAVDRHPQNRIWREELAALHSVAADWLLLRGELAAARDRINRTIVLFVDLLETDAADVPIRMRVIDELIRFGEVSARINDRDGAWRGFYTAAQDCSLLLIDDPTIRQWAFKTRVWAIVEGLKWKDALVTAESTIEKQNYIDGAMTQFKSLQLDLDLEWARQSLHGEVECERPESLFVKR